MRRSRILLVLVLAAFLPLLAARAEEDKPPHPEKETPRGKQRSAEQAEASRQERQRKEQGKKEKGKEEKPATKWSAGTFAR